MPEPALAPDRAAATPSADPATEPAARDALASWRDAYVGRLTAPDGWWAIQALVWLDEGPTLAGSDADAAVRLPAPFAGHAATLRREGTTVTVAPEGPEPLWENGVPVGEPAIVHDRERTFASGPEADAARFAVLIRGDRRGVRVFDPARAAEHDPNRGVAWYDLEPGWVLPALFEPAAEGETVGIVTQLGDVLDTPAAGRLRFERDGVEHALLATWSGEQLFVNFRDAGSGTESYGAGRFLTVAAPDANENAVLDFHRAHHPPCAHSAFATCPLPPLANRLPFVVRAGERTASE